MQMFSDADRTLARKFRCLGHPVRLRILKVLSAIGDAQLSVIELAARLGDMPQPTLSHHLQYLSTAGFVGYRMQRGRQHYYYVEEHSITDAQRSLAHLLE